MTVNHLVKRDFDGLDHGVGHKDGVELDMLNAAPKVLRLEMSSRVEGKHLLGILHETKAVKILDVTVDVQTLEATGTTTVDVGVEGVDDNGLGAAMSVAAAGKVKAEAVATVGGSETYWSANTRGALNSAFVVGTDTDGDFGLYNPKDYWCPANTQLSYTVPSGGWTEFVGDLLVTYLVDPDENE